MVKAGVDGGSAAEHERSDAMSSQRKFQSGESMRLNMFAFGPVS
jgi:hypothetical protein